MGRRSEHVIARGILNDELAKGVPVERARFRVVLRPPGYGVPQTLRRTVAQRRDPQCFPRQATDRRDIGGAAGRISDSVVVGVRAGKVTKNLTGVAVAIGGGKSGQGVTRFGQCVAGRLLAVGQAGIHRTEKRAEQNADQQ